MLVNRLSMSALLVTELAAAVEACEASLQRMTCMSVLLFITDADCRLTDVRIKCHL